MREPGDENVECQNCGTVVMTAPFEDIAANPLAFVVFCRWCIDAALKDVYDA